MAGQQAPASLRCPPPSFALFAGHPLYRAAPAVAEREHNVYFDDARRFFQAKNKVMAVAFGRTEDDQYAENIGEIGRLLMRSGEMAVLFTNRSRAEVCPCSHGWSVHGHIG